jgi:hypothetical protein
MISLIYQVLFLLLFVISKIIINFKFLEKFNSHKNEIFTKKQQPKIKRTRRSTSSTCSSNSICFDLPQRTAKPSTSSYIILNDSHNKFDLDNIVIPFEMLINNNNQTKIDIIQNKEILTPKWRFIDQIIDTEQETIEEIEDLSDSCFLKRHDMECQKCII